MEDDLPISHRVKKAFSSNLFELPEDLPLDSDIFEEGLDSMGLMQLILVLENEFEISFEVNDLAKENFQNIGSISALVTRKLNHLAP